MEVETFVSGDGGDDGQTYINVDDSKNS